MIQWQTSAPLHQFKVIVVAGVTDPGPYGRDQRSWLQLVVAGPNGASHNTDFCDLA